MSRKTVLYAILLLIPLSLNPILPENRDIFFEASHNNLKYVQEAIRSGVDINIKNRYSGHTLLMTVANNGHYQLAEYLIANGIEINARDDHGWTALMGASHYGHERVIRLLLQKGANLHIVDDEGTDALSLACSNGNENIIKLLLSNKADVNRSRALASYMASEHPIIEMVKFLIQKGADVHYINNNGESLLSAAISEDISIVKLLLEKGVAINNQSTEDGVSPLFEAVSAGRVVLVELLLKKGAKVNFHTKKDYYGKDGRSPLIEAVHPMSHLIEDRKTMVRLLLDYGSDPNAVDKWGNTPLHYAAYINDYEVVEMLLKKNAAVETENEDGETALDFAVKNKCRKIIDLLKKYKK